MTLLVTVRGMTTAALIIPALLSATPSAARGFRDVSAELGIQFRHTDGRSGKYYFPETVGAGAAWVDLDDDGDLDLYLVNGSADPSSGLVATNTLYENRNGHYVDVTLLAGVGDASYGMGVCAADFDGDRRLDLFVTNLGPDRLYRNLGRDAEGVLRFEETATPAGVAGAVWSSSCAFGDIDNDGDLDLYVAHYVDFQTSEGPECIDHARNLPFYCHPNQYPGLSDDLFINQGDGTFRPEGRRRGLAQGGSERGLGVAMSDLDDDGDLDIYVTNDSSANRFYRNRGDGTFEDFSLMSGTALSGDGARQAGMGIGLGDSDGDGKVDLVVTNFSLEPNTLYRNEGDGLFRDDTRASGLLDLTFTDLGWGVEFLDYDLDGDLDLAVANGHVMDNIDRFVPGQTYAQRNRLFGNDGRGKFRDVSGESGAAWQRTQVSRGLSVGDFDNDGRPDLLITNSNDLPNLLLNEVETSHHWLGLRLIGPPKNHFAIGAKVTLRSTTGSQVREVRSGSGVLVQDDFRLLFGLGSTTGPIKIEVRWPDGRRQEEVLSEIDRYWVLDYSKTP